MGSVLSYFRRKKTSLEDLQDIDEILKSIDEYHLSVQKRRKLTESFLFYAMMFLIIFGSSYLYFFPSAFHNKWMIWGILIFLSILLLFLRRIVKWYFERKLRQNRTKRNDAVTAKDKIINNVMETETYNTAKRILEQYAPHMKNRLLITPQPRQMQLMQPGNELRQRHEPLRQSAQNPLPAQQRDGAPVQRPFIESKSMINRLVELLLGDGPANRYALICDNCHEHNGLVLPEEFMYISFRCSKCHKLHSPRQQRPSAPRLPEFVPDREMSNSSTAEDTSSDKEKDDEPEADNSPEPSSVPGDPAEELAEPSEATE